MSAWISWVSRCRPKNRSRSAVWNGRGPTYGRMSGMLASAGTVGLPLLPQGRAKLSRVAPKDVDLHLVEVVAQVRLYLPFSRPAGLLVGQVLQTRWNLDADMPDLLTRRDGRKKSAEQHPKRPVVEAVADE